MKTFAFAVLAWALLAGMAQAQTQINNFAPPPTVQFQGGGFQDFSTAAPAPCPASFGLASSSFGYTSGSFGYVRAGVPLPVLASPPAVFIRGGFFRPHIAVAGGGVNVIVPGGRRPFFRGGRFW